MCEEMNFSVLLGKALIAIRGRVGDDEMQFTTTDGQTFKMWHDQDCCENVRIEDIAGDLDDLIGEPLVEAEEATSSEDPEGYRSARDYRDSFTWTFYKLRTRKGAVTIRWLGESNGYYSESVSFGLMGDAHEAE